MLCPSCSHENRDNARFCESCGGALAPRCAQCGAELRDSARFCDGCGAPVTAGETTPSASTPTPAPSPALPASFANDRYTVQRFLGEGGRKKVYLAHDSKLDRDVAVAVIKTDGLDEDGLKRVKREAQAMGRLGDHPNIVTVFDIGDDLSSTSGRAGQPYIVSQYMGGGDLEGMLNKAPGRRLSIPEAMRIAQQVQQGLAHAHDRGIIHRDLKPGNIWLTEDGAAKIGDFGLAVSLERSRLTMEGMMVGTVSYMAPEQALGRQPDARSDLYSLGCVTYEMITGRAPFLGDDPVAIISQHINTAPVAPSWHNPEVPRALESLVLRLLAKDPNERPESAAAIPQALQAIMDTASTTAPAAAESDVNPLDRLAAGIFVGREKEMDDLRAGLEDSLSGRGRLMMLVGEPGIGKTRTSEEFATYARLRSVQVLWGRCYEGEGAPAYWPWVQIIRSYAHDKDPKELMSEMGPGAADIAQVVSEVGERLPGLPPPPALEPEQARFRLFDSITTFLKNASKTTPLMVVLDDMHWADKPSLLLLQFLAKELRGSRLLVLGTYRDVELRRQHPLAQTLGELNRENLSQRVLLRGLTANDVRRFVEVTAGTTPPDALVQAVYRETEGNPFFVNEIVRLLVADGRLEQAEGVKEWSVTIPQSVREVVGRRLDHLSEDCNKVLTIGSVIGREFGLQVLEKVSEVKGDQLLEALEEAAAARVIAELPRSPDHYWFAHALIRETLYEELSTTRRIRLHRQIGDALEELYGDNPEAHLAELAHHFSEAAQGGDVDKAVDYAVRAAERATALVAYEEAVVHYSAALQAIELKKPPEEGRRCDLLLALSDAHFMAGDTEQTKSTLDMAVELSRTLKDVVRLAMSAQAIGRLFYEVGIVREPVVALLEEALQALSEEDASLRARLLTLLSREVYFSSSDRSRTFADEAIAVARSLGDPATISFALHAQLFGGGEVVGLRERLEIANEAIDLAEQAGDPVLQMSGHFSRTMYLLILGDIAELDREITVFTRLAQEMRHPSFLWQAAILPAMRALLDGRIDDAERLAQEALTAGQRTEGANAMQMYGAQIFALRREQGRLGEMEAGIKGFVQMYPAVPAWRTALALLHAEMGREKEARKEFEILAADDFVALPRDGNWPVGMALLSEVCVFLGDRERAAFLYEELRTWEDLCILIGPAIDCYGAASRLLGRLATTMGHWEDAERHFEHALKRNTEMGSGRWITRTRLQYAMMLAERDAPGDQQKALALLSGALDMAQRLGMKRDLEDALALKLKIQGVDLSGIDTSIDTVAREVLVAQPDLRPQAAPDGTVTIMFSDIEGSTEKTEQLGDTRWMEVLRAHNAIIREQLKAHDGFEVKSEGDGFMLAFQSARKAIQCAVAIQKAMSETLGAPIPPSAHPEAHEGRAAPETPQIRVRMGLHTGEVIKEGDDFFGKHVNLAARVAGKASGGEILASSLLRELTASGGDIAFGDPRTVEFKGLTGEHQVWPVEWAS